MTRHVADAAYKRRRRRRLRRLCRPRGGGGGSEPATENVEQLKKYVATGAGGVKEHSNATFEAKESHTTTSNSERGVI